MASPNHRIARRQCRFELHERELIFECLQMNTGFISENREQGTRDANAKHVKFVVLSAKCVCKISTQYIRWF